MNNALESLKSEYKPYRFIKKKNITILETTSGTIVVKEKKNDHVKETYQYLKSRGFDYFPNLVGEDRKDVNTFEFIHEVPMQKEQKALDLIDLVSLLHNKTTYYKEVSEDVYKDIYNQVKEHIVYARNHYDTLYQTLIEEIYPSPSHYLLLRNLYKIYGALDYAGNELDNWYELVKNDLKVRVAYIHNDLETDHFIKNDRDYLISWDKSKVDSPILDLMHFYEKEGVHLDFVPLMMRYEKNYPLKENEKKLLFVILSIPPIITLQSNEMDLTRTIRSQLDYIFKTENFIKELSSSEDK